MMLASLLLISFVVRSYGFHLNKLSGLQQGRHLLMAARDAATIQTEKSAKKSQKPVILLDVDGVINILNDRVDRRVASLKQQDAMRLEYAQSVWEDARVGTKDNIRMFYSPTVVSKINAWSEHAEIRWLSAWGARAPEELAPLMGINAFPYLPYEQVGIRRSPKALFAQMVAHEVGPDRLIIWLDDDLSDWLPKRSTDKGAFLLPHVIWKYDAGMEDCVPTSGADIILRPNTLYVGPWCGLAPKHLDLVDKYLADPSLAAGKAIYELDGGHFERQYTKGEQLKEGELLDTYQSNVFSDFSNTVAFPL